MMRIADGVEMLELEMNMMGNKSTINPTLFYDDEQAVLVDAGMPGHLGLLKSAMEQAGIPLERIKAVIFTHQDIDHIGGIKELQQAVGKPIDVYAHAEDQPYIEGDKSPIKMDPERVAKMLERLPEDMRKQAESLFLNPPTAKVTKVVTDGEVLPFFGGVQVIHTPGHTPGHICLYHVESKTLVTGDATVSQDGKLLGPSAQATYDMDLAQESHKKFTNFDINQAICYHGGLCDKQVNEQMKEFAKNH